MYYIPKKKALKQNRHKDCLYPSVCSLFKWTATTKNLKIDCIIPDNPDDNRLDFHVCIFTRDMRHFVGYYWSKIDIASGMLSSSQTLFEKIIAVVQHFDKANIPVHGGYYRCIHHNLRETLDTMKSQLIELGLTNGAPPICLY